MSSGFGRRRRVELIRRARNFARQFAGRHRDLQRLAFSPNGQLDVLPDLLFQDLALKLRVGGHRRAIDLRDDIERAQVAFVSRRVGLDRAHDHALVEAFEQIADRRVVA